MDFKVELKNIDYTDKKLITSLEGISKYSEFSMEFCINEFDILLNTYFIEKLDVDLDVSNMYFDLEKGRLYYDNIFEAAMVTNVMINYFGSSCISAGGTDAQEQQDYYNLNLNPIIRKVVGMGGYYIESEMGIKISYDYADDFLESWIYKYLITKGEIE